MDGNENTPSTTIALVITLDQLTGAINVTGPIQNVVICYGMLESAKDAIWKYAQDNSSPILPGSSFSLVRPQ